MSHNYSYDTQGLTSSYLLLSFLIPLLVFLILKKKKKSCSCTFHSKSAPSKRNTYIFILSTVISLLLYKIFTTKVTVQSKFDPYKILNIDESSTKKEIKKAFRKFLKKRENDPDFAPEHLKQEVNDRLVEITKAYNLLLTGVKKEEVLEESVALPAFLVGYKLFFVYVFVLGVIFPLYGIKKWAGSVYKNRLGVDYASVDVVYARIEKIRNWREFLDLLNDCEEFRSDELKANMLTDFGRKMLLFSCDTNEKDNLIHEKNISNTSAKKINSTDVKCESSKCATNLLLQFFSSKLNTAESKKKIKQFLEKKFGYPLKANQKIFYYILMDHLFRTDIFRAEVKTKVVEQVLNILECSKKIAIAKKKDPVFLFDFQRMIFQAVFDEEFWMMQNPGISFGDLIFGREIRKEDVFLPAVEVVDFEAFVGTENNVDDEESDSVDDACDLNEEGNDNAKGNDNDNDNDNDNEEGNEDDNDNNNKQMNNDIKKNNKNSNDNNNKDNKITAEMESYNSVKPNTQLQPKTFKIDKSSLVTAKLTLTNPFSPKKPEDGSFILKYRGETDLELLNSRNSKNTPVHSFLQNEKNVVWEAFFFYNNKLINSVVFSDFDWKKELFVEFWERENGKLRVEVRNGQVFGKDCFGEIAVEYV